MRHRGELRYGHSRTMRPFFSVVIPTYNRVNVVSESVIAFERQQFSARFEVIVVVDGSNDGTADYLRSLRVSFLLRVLEQVNSGASAARNRGAAAARGRTLLFLDDDMEADPELLAQHLRSHRDGADIVIGHIPLHPASPAGFLSEGVRAWAEQRLLRLSSPGAKLASHDVLTGQLSISKRAFEKIGGFDTAFTRDGTFGKEDIDFGVRAQRLGLRISFNSRAISWQRYVVQPDAYLRQRRHAGSADVRFVRKHPDQIGKTFGPVGGGRLLRPAVGIPVVAPLVAWAVKRSALGLIRRGSNGHVARRLFGKACILEYWTGVREAGGVPDIDPPRVLAYHSIAEVSDDSPLAQYTIRPAVFIKQIDTLIRAGFHFIDANALCEYLQGRRLLPSRAVLLTFDDCYTDLLDTVLPVLRARNIPAVAFAVTGQIGGTNAWDRHLGAPELRLLGADGIRMLAAAGFEIGAHSRTHRLLPEVPECALVEEVSGCVSDIEALGLPRPRLFAYPYGGYGDRVEAALRTTGMEAGFTVERAPLNRQMNPLMLPRIAIFSTHVGGGFANAIAPVWPGRRWGAVRAMRRDLQRAWQEIDSCLPLERRVCFHLPARFRATDEV